MINKSFWKGKKVFLKGHTGFKGSWMSMWLSELGADVFGYSLAPESSPNHYSILNLEDRIHSTIGDIRDLEKLKRKMKIANPEILIHMAAQPLVRRSYHDPVDTYSTNVMGTVNVLESARQCPDLKVIVNVTTDKVYENLELDVPFKERDRLGGFDPYSNSKACSELITSSYRSSFLKDSQVKIVTARAGNVIGGGDWSEDRLIPDIVRACEKKTIVDIRNPNAIRPWQHVLESINGYLKLVEYVDSHDSFETSWNFGPGATDFMTVGEVLKFIQNEIPEMELKFRLNQSDLYESQILKLDNSQALNRLGWKSRWSYSQAIKNTMDWYLKFSKGGSSFDMTLEQIKQFEGS